MSSQLPMIERIKDTVYLSGDTVTKMSECCTARKIATGKALSKGGFIDEAVSFYYEKLKADKEEEKCRTRTS